MRIQNKYIRNRHFRQKHWNRERVKHHPYETYMPYMVWSYPTKGENKNSTEAQIKWHFDLIAQRARDLENGTHRQYNHAPKHYRKIHNDKRKAAERKAMARVRQGIEDIEFPVWKKYADWYYF